MDNANAPPMPLNILAAPCPFSMWGIDVIGAIEPKASNGHRFILVTIDYFTKWVEAASYASVTRSMVVRFIKKEINSQRNLFRDILDFFEVVCFYHYCYYYLKMNNVLLMKLKLLYWSYLVILVWLLPGYFNEDWWWFPAGIIMVWNDAGFSHVLSLYILAEISFYFSILTSRFLQLNFIKHFLGGGFIKHMQVGFCFHFCYSYLLQQVSI